MSLNRYLYGQASPQVYTDPSGHEGELAGLMLQLSLGAVLVSAVGYLGNKFLDGGPSAGITDNDVVWMKYLVDNALARTDTAAIQTYFDSSDFDHSEVVEKVQKGWARIQAEVHNPNFLFGSSQHRPAKDKNGKPFVPYRFILQTSAGWRTWIRGAAILTAAKSREVVLERGFFKANDNPQARAESSLAGVLAWTKVAEGRTGARIPEDWTDWAKYTSDEQYARGNPWNWVAMANGLAGQG